MANCGRCGKKLGFFQSKYNCEDDRRAILKCCSECYEKSQRKENQRAKDTSHFDSGMKKRFEYLIRKFRNEEKDMELPIDPKEYDDNCWVCLDNDVSVRWYKGFRKICSDCVDVLESTENLNQSSSSISRIKKEKRDFLIKREVRQEKEKIEKQQLKGKNTPLIADFCNKYLSSKNFDFKGIILGICRNKDLFGLIYENDLDFLQEHFVKLYRYSQEQNSTTSADYDEQMSLETTCNNAVQLIADVTKIRKLLDKKGVKSDYIQIFEEMAKIVEQDIKKTIEKLTIPAYKRISKIATTDKKTIVKEYLKLGFDEPNEMIISDLFEKFGLESNNEEIRNLLTECIEENELDEFENHLGLENEKNIKDFSNLNGHQFEDYLKEVFSILGYQVMRTKLSGDQGADLIIKKDDEKTVVQAKKYFGSVTNKAIQEVVASKKHYGAEKAMVVTTGTFTKSAIKLAKSNKVGLWDKDKLKSIISNINKSSKGSKGFHTEQSVSLQENYFPTFCPFCESEIKLKIEDLPKKNKQKTMSCPECNVDLGISIPEKFYYCVGCKKEFETVKERIEHSKQCKKVKDRQFNCTHCKKEFTCDDDELEEFSKKGSLKVECPVCKTSNVLKR